MKNRKISDYKDYADLENQAEIDKILNKVTLQKGIDTLLSRQEHININTNDGIEKACAQMVELLYGSKGYFKDIKLIEVLDEGKLARYTVFIGIKPTNAMIQMKLTDDIGQEFTITSTP